MDRTRIMGGDEADLTCAHLTANSDCSNQLWSGSEHVATILSIKLYAVLMA